MRDLCRHSPKGRTGGTISTGRPACLATSCETLPSNTTTIDAKVDDGVVRLTGTANWQFQREEAESVAGNIIGVMGVVDEVQLVAPGPTAHDVEHSIKKAMERNAKLDAESVSVESSNGTITLKGTVGSWADHDEAVSAAWAAPGVTRVKDHILVAY